ncbi:MAG TPA: LysR substrate-binding domain-containing protein [Chthonomonadaceae bacterium]|nr:LysR substrate-binding domain-containing protein [Chthonomonadaceae bacterium]
MELRHLRYFIAVAEELHFGRAAERLCIAQPPLSQQIRQLEQELGFALFTRTQRRVEITPAGHLFLDEARELLANLEKAVAAGRRVARGEVGWLGIGFVGTATYEFLPAVLSAFRERYPEVELVLRELVSAKQAQALRDRRIHVGLARPAIQEEGIVSETVVREALVAALPESHPLAARERLSLPALAAEPFILFPRQPRPSYAEAILALCAEAGFRPHVVQETAEIHTAISLVAAGLGVTIVPASVQSAHWQGIAYRHFEAPQPMTELTAAYRAGETSPIVHAFLKIARAIHR